MRFPGWHTQRERKRQESEKHMDISNLISLLSGIALFLFGISLMGAGLKKIAGNRLEILLYRLTNTTWKGLLLGTGVTAVIQSSSATSVMVVGFVNSSMMRFRQAIGIILGSILGTSITGWIICLSSIGGGGGWIQLLSTSTLTGVISVVGIILHSFCKDPSKVHIGDILMGFAVLMFGMSVMSDAVSPLRESAVFLNALTLFSNPILGILIGALFTSVLQSASAAVGILQALSATGVIDFSTAFPIIMGIAIGAAVPVLLSALGASTDGKRTAFIYLFIQALGAAICGGVFYAANAIHPFAVMSVTMNTASIALLNTVFRLVTVIILFPFIGLLEKATCRIIKERTKDSKKAQTELIQLEDRFLPYPALAISQCRDHINAMAERARDSITAAFDVLLDYSDSGFERVAELEEQLDRYEDNIGTYLIKVTRLELDSRQNTEVSKFLHTIPDFERISDHALNIAELAQEIHQKSVVYSDEAVQELAIIRKTIIEIVTTTVDAFVRDDLRLASKVEPLERHVDVLCDELKLHHVNRLQKGVCTLEQGFTFHDLLTNYERISDHCSNIALAMIELELNAFMTHEYIKSADPAKEDKP